MNDSHIKSQRSAGKRARSPVSAAALTVLVAAGTSGVLAACSSSSTSNAVSTPTAANWESFRAASQRMVPELNAMSGTPSATTESCQMLVKTVTDLKNLPDSPSASVNAAFDKLAADLKVVANDCEPIINGTATQEQTARVEEAAKAADADGQKVVEALEQANAPGDIKSLWAPFLPTSSATPSPSGSMVGAPPGAPVLGTPAVGEPFTLTTTYAGQTQPSKLQITVKRVTCGKPLDPAVTKNAATSVGESPSAGPTPEAGKKFCVVAMSVKNVGNSETSWDSQNTVSLNVGAVLYTESSNDSRYSLDYAQYWHGQGQDGPTFGLQTNSQGPEYGVFEIPTGDTPTSLWISSGLPSKTAPSQDTLFSRSR
ncbi:hypothetical protein ACFQZC_00315 [Streptacidiphilus monticola]